MVLESNKCVPELGKSIGGSLLPRFTYQVSLTKAHLHSLTSGGTAVSQA
jgi:hypothetical protein